MQRTNTKPFERADWIAAGIFALLSAAVYFLSVADYVYPGESARLAVLWSGLDTAAKPPYPLMAFFAKLFGGGNALAPVCGAVSVTLVYLLVSLFVRIRTFGEFTVPHAPWASRIAGAVAAVVFMFTPAVRSAATHLEPRMFAFAWLLLSTSAIAAWRVASVSLPLPATPFAALVGVMWGLGAVDSALFFATLPLAALGVAMTPLASGRKPYIPVLAFFVAFAAAFGVLASNCGGFTGTLETSLAQLKSYTAPEGWLLVALFATVPFVISLFSSGKAFNERSDIVQLTFHLALSFFSVLAVATPLSPSSLMEERGVMPVATSAFAAAVAGYLAAYWYYVARAKFRLPSDPAAARMADAAGRRAALVSVVAGIVLSVAYGFISLFNLFAFDTRAGDFADRVARRIVNDLGDRTWLISDGLLDNHLKLAAASLGRPVEVVSLNRDADRDYLDRLCAKVRELGVGGEQNAELALSLSLGVLPFVQDWFAGDASVVSKVAIFGAPDLWYSAGVKPVPEFLFFGGDAGRASDWSDWKALSELLHAPAGWGSHHAAVGRSPVERMRLNLRRHVGMVANNRGVWLQDQGRDDEAFDMYDRVLNDIDADNVCALYNMYAMANAGHEKAKARKFDLEKRIQAVVDDKTRRYKLVNLSLYYGYIRNPDFFVRLGYTWARSGRPGDALRYMRRAIEFVPEERRGAFASMMAALYAEEGDVDKSRETYQRVLASQPENHAALIGMMRLALLDNNERLAIDYLARAVRAGGDDPSIRTEAAMLALMRGKTEAAKRVLKTVTDAEPGNMRAWSLTAAVVMRQCDTEKDPAKVKQLEAELDDVIIPSMEKNAKSGFDYNLQTVKAFSLMRKGSERRREARDAFAAAVRMRPGASAMSDIVLNLDISLDDEESAERHARAILVRNRKAPLANYIMGSLALKKGDIESAKTYLHRAADAKRPTPLAMNDLAEAYRREKSYDEAERYARLAVKANERLYIAWETLGSILLDRKGDLDEARVCIEKACEMSKAGGRPEDVRALMSLARVYVAKDDRKMARATLRKVQARLSELSEFEKKEYEEIRKNAR